MRATSFAAGANAQSPDARDREPEVAQLRAGSTLADRHADAVGSSAWNVHLSGWAVSP
jgi:hypothetical protein